MKNTFTMAWLLLSTFIYAQDCDPFTASQDLIQGKLKQTILRGEGGILNPLYIKTGIGTLGDIDTRTYAPLIHSSNVWAGGLTPSGNIKLAAGQYSQQDWTPGPLDIDGYTTSSICNDWDRIWSVSKEDILKAREVYLTNGPCDQIPLSVLNWPGRNNPNLPFLPADQSLADFWDEGDDGMFGDGVYNPCDGDLPILTVRGCEPNTISQAIAQTPSNMSYYIMNDNGAPHQVSQASPLQMEVQVYTFTFKSQEAEGIIFTKHKFINKASEDIREFKFSQWTNFDLGCSTNDKLGSDKNQQMVYAYNGSTEENCNNSLENFNVSVGYSYLSKIRGPFLIVEGSDGQDSLISPSPGTGAFDTLAAVGVSNVIIPNNCLDPTSPPNCSPQNTLDYYNLTRNINFDGTTTLDNNEMQTSFMFSGNPANTNEWSQCTDLSVAESTAIISSANILLQPQAVQEIISAYYYTDDIDSYCPDVASIKYKDNVVQSLYDNCFFHYNGPPAPQLRVLYSDDGMGVDLDLFQIPTNYSESIPKAFSPLHTDLNYNFEGIKIYQVASKNFDMTELNNPSMSVLVYQGDLSNNITDITNYRSDFIGADQTWIEDTKVIGANNGIESEISLIYDFIRDQPIEISDELYYVAVSYGYNNYEEFDPLGWIDDDGTPHSTGQQYRYIETTCGLTVEESVISVSSTKSPLEAGLYEYVYNNNIINLFNIEEALSLQLLTIDGKSLEQWNANKGDTFYSNKLSDRYIGGLYILNVTAAHSGLNGSHKLVVIQ